MCVFCFNDGGVDWKSDTVALHQTNKIVKETCKIIWNVFAWSISNSNHVPITILISTTVSENNFLRMWTLTPSVNASNSTFPGAIKNDITYRIIGNRRCYITIRSVIAKEIWQSIKATFLNCYSKLSTLSTITKNSFVFSIVYVLMMIVE